MLVPLPIIFLLLLFLLSSSAFFSGSETALFSLSNLKIKRLLDQKKNTAPVIIKLLENPRRTLITILTGNMTVNVLISSISAALALKFFGEKGLEFSIIAVTFFILIFGEIFPKSLAIHHNEALAQIVARPINFLAWLITPIRFILRVITDWVTAPISKQLGSTKYAASSDYLKTAVAVAHEEGLVEDYQKKILEGLFDFREKTVRQMLTPRSKIFKLNFSDTFDEALKKISQKNYSRIPVIGGTIDEIKGILYTKELIKLKFESEEAQRNWPKLLKPAYFVPETKKAPELLKELIESGIHLALVVNETGCISGLVTLDDLLEEIF